MLTSDDVARNSDKTLSVAMARQPVAGNWIRPANEGNIVLQLVVSNTHALRPEGGLNLPKIQRVSC